MTRELKRVVVKYVDPKYAGLQFNSKSNYKNSEWGFELQFMEISQIRQRQYVA